MTTAAFVLVAMALAAAIVDWIAVVDKDRKLEYLCKPLTIVLLIGVALALEPESTTMRTWFVSALVFSLAGDVFLMLKERDFFVLGLASFLVAHVAYVLGFLVGGVGILRLLGGVVVAGVAVVLVGSRIVRAAQESDPQLVVPVMAYMGVISVMLAVAIGSGDTAAVAGAVLFYVSDALIGWTKFVHAHTWAPLAVIVTYHLAQIALVTSLA